MNNKTNYNLRKVIFYTVTLSIIVTFVSCDKIDHTLSGDSKSIDRMKKGEFDVEITASKLVKEYEDNEVAADKKYKGKIIKVSGKAEKISKDVIGSDMTVSLKSSMSTLTSGGIVDEPSFRSVSCAFDKDSEDALASIKNGSTVTIIGICDELMVDVQLKHCKLQ